MTTALSDVQVVAGVSLFTQEPYVQVTARMEDGTAAHGQLTAKECLEWGAQWITAAHSAMNDANLVKVLREEFHMGERETALILTLLRDARG